MPRKKPFSSKQKKKQLQQKKMKKKTQSDTVMKQEARVSSEVSSSNSSDSELQDIPQDPTLPTLTIKKLSCLPEPVETGLSNTNKFSLYFKDDTHEEVEKKKKQAKTSILVPVKETELQVSFEDIYHPGVVLDIPKRPAWSYGMTKPEVEKQEEDMFAEYVKNILSTYQHQNLSYFELNLETWRQLWRVLELSDIVLLIVDIRHPVLHFSPFLYRHITHELKKQLVLVLNKVDLIPFEVAVAWKHYFLTNFPDISVVFFTCYASDYSSSEHDKKIKTKLKRKRKRSSIAGSKELLDVIEKLSMGKGDTMELSKQISHADTQELLSSTVSTGSSILTIGLVGQPNVGKSSVLNALMGKKYVSTSKTPGHTKHLQTIFLTPNVRLCDCPGLVFPSLVDKRLQILCGIYPIAQVKEPYTSVGYLAERVPLIDLLCLSHPQEEDSTASSDDLHLTALKIMKAVRHTDHWTAWDICDAWAKQKKYFTSKAARLDTYRAANHLLRLTNEGKICLFFKPPNFLSLKDEWERHPDVMQLISLLQHESTTEQKVALSESESDSDSDFEEDFVFGCFNKFSALLNIEDESYQSS